MKIANALLVLLMAAACAHAPADTQSRLETTPRHDEWIDVDGPARKVRTWVVYPQRSDRAMAVVLIHENRGLTDWVRSVADRLAEEGYIAVAPDLLSGMAPGGGGTRDFPTEDAAREAISRVTPAQAVDDLRAVIAWARKIPSGDGGIAVAGFCWGGARTWEVADAVPDLRAAFVFYGTGPQDPAGVDGIEAPVFGFYGEDDERVNATVSRSRELMFGSGKRFEASTYGGAGHAFMRLGEAPDAKPANQKARDLAWRRWLDLLRKIDK